MKGFMDHWAPTQDDISTFWKSDFKTCSFQLNKLRHQIQFDHFTFYTKWYTNGIYSSLPFLVNHPEASNTKTKNKWGRKLIDYLHSQEVSVGAMLQLYMFDKKAWGPDAVLGAYDERRIALTDDETIVADFTTDLYQARLVQVLEEHLRLYPDFDYFFLEFEGVGDTMVEKIYPAWASSHDKPPLTELTFSDEMRAYGRELNLDIHADGRPNIMWSQEGQELLTQYMRMNVETADRTLKRMNYKGIKGIVYHLYRHESAIISTVMSSCRDWWLLPWHYWGGESAQELAFKEVRKQAGKNHLRRMQKAGWPVCYLGDATIACYDLDSIREFWDFTQKEKLAGYLGMGHPNPDFGLRWYGGVTRKHIEQAAALFQELYGKP